MTRTHNNKQKAKKVNFDQVLRALLDNAHPFPAKFLHMFSDMSDDDIDILKMNWAQIVPDRRANLLDDLSDLIEADTLVYFDDLAEFALDDPDSRVRQNAMRLIWETMPKRLVPKVIKMLKTDPEAEVRAQAASNLGFVVYQGELEEIPAVLWHKTEDALLEVLNGKEDELVLRRCLEALGYSSRDEVPELILKAFHSDNVQWVISAIFAMGRSANERWTEQVMSRIDDPNPEILFEAVRASGELAIKAAVPYLINYLDLEEQDIDTHYAAIWSLSEIGGEDVRETLQRMSEETDDEDEQDALDEALENLAFTEDVNKSMNLLDLGIEVENDDFDDIIDLSEDDLDKGPNKR